VPLDNKPAEIGKVITAQLRKRRGGRVLHIVVEASGAIDEFVKDLKKHGLTLWLDPEPVVHDVGFDASARRILQNCAEEKRPLTPEEVKKLESEFIHGVGDAQPTGFLSPEAWKDGNGNRATSVGFDPAAFQCCHDCPRPRLCNNEKRCMCAQVKKFSQPPDEDGFCADCPDTGRCLALGGCSGFREATS